MVKHAALLLVTSGLLGCAPDFGSPASLVNTHRILATKAEPPEVRPGDSATFTALVVSPNGTEAAPPIDWALCLAPKPLDENNVVTSACLDGGSNIMAFGSQTQSAMAMVPLLACSLFGPDPPPQVQGQPPLRPRDPDITGGFYQPLRLIDGDAVAFGLERITCDLTQGGPMIAVQYGMTYKANKNPTLMPLTAMVNGASVFAAGSMTGTVPGGQKVQFTASWPADSAEIFPVYDIVAQQLVMQREALRVSWFATDGAFDHEITGRDQNDMATSVDNVWTAPKSPGAVVRVWAVLRDSRGGSDFAATSYDLTIQ